MRIFHEKAFAKINLTLDVLARRADGYHALVSVMQSVTLGDEIVLQLETGAPWMLTCSRAEIPNDRRNLAWRAAETFFSAYGAEPDGLSIHIEKRIPSEAGLGGGSADAAAVLRVLNRAYHSPYDSMELAAIGAQVGSDVPFCVLGGTAMAEGRGERLRRLPPMPRCKIVIVKPDFSASTPALFRQLDEYGVRVRPDTPAMERALMQGDLAEIARHVRNVFDPMVASIHPEIAEIKRIAAENGALCAEMTGSGSAVFALFGADADAQTAVSALRSHGFLSFLAEPV